MRVRVSQPLRNIERGSGLSDESLEARKLEHTGSTHRICALGLLEQPASENNNLRFSQYEAKESPDHRRSRDATAIGALGARLGHSWRHPARKGREPKSGQTARSRQATEHVTL